MLVLFAFGLMNAGWMLAFGVVMAVEKSSRFGAKLSTPIGVLLGMASVAVLIW